MGINDRILNIAKSYFHSASESLEDGLDDILKRWESGSLGEDIKKVFQSKPDSDSLSKEEVERILREEFGPEPKGSPRTPPPSRKKQTDLEKAYKRLGVTPQTPMSEIKKAFKKEILKYHPDHFGDDKKKAETATKVAQMLTEALETIKKARQGEGS